MKDIESMEDKIICSEKEVEGYIEKLRFALSKKSTSLILEVKRKADANKEEQYTNRYTLAKLFADEDERKALKRELRKLRVEDYIHTLHDLETQRMKKLWVFGKRYDKDVYIKIRVEILENHIVIKSFHYAKWVFKESDFPYRKKR